MFTGLIEEVGNIISIHRADRSATFRIGAKGVLDGLKVGDSISTNGVCLTVTSFDKGSFAADVMPETMSRSNLFELKPEAPVNLERAMMVGDRFGGHIVSGHIDGTGTIDVIKKDENATWLEISVNTDLLRYIIEKGSVAIDGISLTVARVTSETFSVSIIPLTGSDTTLLKKKVGEKLNIECDVVGKYVESLFGDRFTKRNLTMDFLKENGFA
jgi:riboflavin synthase